MAICKGCGEEARLIKIDVGIGSYEYWGCRGNDSQIEVVTECCEDDFELGPNESIDDHFEPVDYEDYEDDRDFEY